MDRFRLDADVELGAGWSGIESFGPEFNAKVAFPKGERAVKLRRSVWESGRVSCLQVFYNPFLWGAACCSAIGEGGSLDAELNALRSFAEHASQARSAVLGVPVAEALRRRARGGSSEWLLLRTVNSMQETTDGVPFPLSHGFHASSRALCAASSHVEHKGGLRFEMALACEFAPGELVDEKRLSRAHEYLELLLMDFKPLPP